jgi:hypothetical protein
VNVVKEGNITALHSEMKYKFWSYPAIGVVATLNELLPSSVQRKFIKTRVHGFKKKYRILLKIWTPKFKFHTESPQRLDAAAKYLVTSVTLHP